MMRICMLTVRTWKDGQSLSFGAQNFSGITEIRYALFVCVIFAQPFAITLYFVARL
jgi:hypothetical protein